MIRRGYRVSGRVQGVGFRWFARNAATGLGLRGTVRNAEDGTVEVVAEGPAELLAELEARLRDGPPPIQVRAVEPFEASGSDLPPDFRIIR
ncbi:MAG TPA: acylphosphatase [Longimicrobiales bacterium]|nr:acylphosphatase [Longimicrobiales bacterium]